MAPPRGHPEIQTERKGIAEIDLEIGTMKIIKYNKILKNFFRDRDRDRDRSDRDSKRRRSRSRERRRSDYEDRGRH